MKMKLLIAVLALLASCLGQDTSLSTIQIPSPIPNWGGYTGAGTIVTPTDFNVPICRLTDAFTQFNFDGTQAGAHFSVNFSGSNTDKRVNYNGTLVAIARNGAGASLILSYSFPDSTHCSASVVYSVPTKSISFSAQPSQPKTLYDVEGAVIKKYDFGDTGGCTLSVPCITTIHNFATGTCLSGIAPVSNSVFLDNHDDSFFAIGFSSTGGQGTGTIVATYQTGVGKGERVLNIGSTSTFGIAPSSVCGDYGPTGLITMLGANCPGAGVGVCGTCTGGVTCPDQMTYHEVYAAPAVTHPWVAFDLGTLVLCPSCGSSGDSDWTWGVEGLTVTTPAFGGHYVMGYQHMVAAGATPFGQNNIWQVIDSSGNMIWPITKFDVTSETSPDNLPSVGVAHLDDHLSWQNVDPNDTADIYISNSSYFLGSGNGINNWVPSGEPPAAYAGIQCLGAPACQPTTNPIPGFNVNEIYSVPLTNPSQSGVPCSSSPCTTRTFNRWAHAGQDTVSFLFNAQNSTATMPANASNYLFTSTQFCGNGDTTNDANIICGGIDWNNSNATYVVGNLINPVTANVGNYAFMLVACSSLPCTSAAAHPTWPQVAPSIITAWSITSNVATFTASNSFTVGQVINLATFGTSTFFNGQQVTVASATGTQFTASFTHANGSATEAGRAQRTVADNNITWAGIGAQNAREDVYAVLTNPSAVLPVHAPVRTLFASDWFNPFDLAQPWPAK